MRISAVHAKRGLPRLIANVIWWLNRRDERVIDAITQGFVALGALNVLMWMLSWV